MAGPRATLLRAACLAALLTIAASHAYLAFPPSRNYQAFLDPNYQNRYYCPHCGQGGGTGRIPSYAGDPFQDVAGNAAFKPFTDRFYAFTNLVQGQELDINITVSTNHGGRMRLSLCPLPHTDPGVNQDCFDKPANWLRRVSSDPKYNNKVYWYLKTTDTPSTVQRFKLPAGMACESGCVLQWMWLGFQSCVMPCEGSDIDVAGECHTNPLNPGVDTCKSQLQCEIFKNVADVMIKKSSSSSGTPVPVPASPSLRPKPSPPSLSPKPPTLPKPPAPRPPSPTPATSPSTPPSSSAGCPTSNPSCNECVAAAKKNPATASLVGSCYSCTLANPADPSSCAACLASSATKDVAAGCLTCISKGLPGWQCSSWCAAAAKTGPAVATCTSCISAPSVDAWGCSNCLRLAKDDASAALCSKCVASGINTWQCGECTKKVGATAIAKCYDCMSKSTALNRWACLS